MRFLPRYCKAGLRRRAVQAAFACSTLLLATPQMVRAESPAPVAGRWIVEGEKSIVEIRNCGPVLCGNIVKVLKPDPQSPKTDINNPNPALRNRPMATLQILSDFRPDRSRWIGTIYDPRSGKIYKSRLKAVGANILDVQGCVAFICVSQTWKRAASQ